MVGETLSKIGLPAMTGLSCGVGQKTRNKSGPVIFIDISSGASKHI